jgi:hypothetical protein
MWEEKTGIKVSPASISRARAALGWTRKKLGRQTWEEKPLLKKRQVGIRVTAKAQLLAPSLMPIF